MNISNLVTKLREYYHLGIRSDNKADKEKKSHIKITINYKDGGAHKISAYGRLSDIKIKEEEGMYTSSLCIYIGGEALAWYHAYDVKSILIES